MMNHYRFLGVILQWTGFRRLTFWLKSDIIGYMKRIDMIVSGVAASAFLVAAGFMTRPNVDVYPNAETGNLAARFGLDIPLAPKVICDGKPLNVSRVYFGTNGSDGYVILQQIKDGMSDHCTLPFGR